MRGAHNALRLAVLNILGQQTDRDSHLRRCGCRYASTSWNLLIAPGLTLAITTTWESWEMDWKNTHTTMLISDFGRLRGIHRRSPTHPHPGPILSHEVVEFGIFVAKGMDFISWTAPRARQIIFKEKPSRHTEPFYKRGAE